MSTNTHHITEYIIILFVSVSFFIGWHVGFQNPVFFNSLHNMDQRAPVSSIDPIGTDLLEMTKISKLLRDGHSPYSLGTYIYPPLVSFLYLPLLQFNQDARYAIMSTLTIASIFIGFLIADKISGEKKLVPAIFLFFIVTTLMSYGLHFELERGQFNVIAMCITLLGVYLHKKDMKLLGILLVSVGIHLKIFPIFFFLLLFLDNLRSKKGLVVNLCAVGVNILLLFILGSNVVGDFISVFAEQLHNPFVWSGNHSFFCYCADKSGVNLCNIHTYKYFFSAYIVLLGMGFKITYIKKMGILNVYLVAMCGLAMCLVPSISHDYKLTIIPIVVYPLFKRLYTNSLEEGSYINLAALSLGVFLYTLLLFSTNFGNTPLTINKAPILISLSILVLITMAINQIIIPSGLYNKTGIHLKRIAVSANSLKSKIFSLKW